jgi:hypothetical protein
MPYKPTGRPAGRPRTSRLTAITVKLPQDLLDAAAVEAQLAQTTLSALLREGLTWRLEQTELRRTTRRAACAEIRAILAQEAARDASARRADAEARAAALPAELAARRKQEAAQVAAAIRAPFLSLPNAVAPEAPTPGELGRVAAIVRHLAPAHPDGVSAAAVLRWCEEQRIVWATPALVELALEMLTRDYGYPASPRP